MSIGGSAIRDGKKRFKRTVLVVCACVIVDAAACLALFTFLSRPGVEAAPAKAGIVLYGGIRALPELDRETMRRINRAFGLYSDGSIEYLLCAGGKRSKKGYHGARIMADKLRVLGVPRDRIYREDESNDTVSNLENALAVANSHGWETVLIISSPLHVWRIKRIISSNGSASRAAERIAIGYAGYSYTDCTPRCGMLEIWGYMHYSGIAVLAGKALPDKAYRTVIDMLRN